MSADLCFTTDSFFFLSFFFFLFFVSYSPSSLNGTQPKVVHARKWVQFKMHARNTGYLIPLQIGGPKTPFWGFHNLTASLTAYIFGMKQDINKRASALATRMGLLHCLETTWTLVHKRLQTLSGFSPIFRKFCIPLHCQASQTEISKRNATKLCQTVDGRPR